MCTYLFKLVFSFSLVKYPEVKLLDHMVVLLLVSLRTSILFSIVAVSIYIPTNSARVFSGTVLIDCFFSLCIGHTSLFLYMSSKFFCLKLVIINNLAYK